MKLMAAVNDVDLDRQRLTLDLAFVTEDVISDLMKLANEGGLLSFSVKLSKREEEVEDIQRNIFFMYVTYVLRQSQADITRDNINSLAHDWKCVYLPSATIVIQTKDGPKEILAPAASLARGKNEVTPERMAHALARIKFDYGIPDNI